MTVASTPTVAGPFTGTGASATLPFAFKCFASSDLIVQSGGTTLNYGGDYTVTLNGDQEGSPGGTVTVSAAANALGVLVYVGLNMALSQPSSFPSQSKWSPSVVEKAFDRVTLLIKQLTALGYSAVVAPLGESLGILPSKTIRAGKYFAFDANGDPSAASGTGNDSALRTDIAASSGAALVGTIRSETGATSRALQSKLRDTAHARDFGLAGYAINGDETTALTSFFNSAIANPGTPHRLDQLTYGYSTALPTINVSNVWLESAGYGIHDTGSVASGCVLSWLGAASPGVSGVTIAPVSGGSNQRLSGIKFRGIALSGSNGNLGTLLSLRSLVDSDIDVGAIEASVTGVYMGVVASLGESRDPQNNKVRVRGRQFIAAGGYILTLDGDATANTSANEFWVKGQISNTPAIKCINSDNNRWHSVELFKSGTATYGMDLLGGPTGAQSSRAEVIDFYSSSVPIVARGTGTYAVASQRHTIKHIDIENGTPSPVAETGATIAAFNAWLTYTPVVTPTSGAITAYTATGEYRFTDGGMVSFTANATITTNGTGASILHITLPITPLAGFAFSASGTERSGTAKALFVDIAPSSTFASVTYADGTYPGADGHVLSISGSYRAVF